jgi:FtsP/CotA-like multicopper oxidase with cupredoxin domain
VSAHSTPGRDDQTVQLDTIEDWTVSNSSPMDHSFNLHAWPFHVLATMPEPRRRRPAKTSSSSGRGLGAHSHSVHPLARPQRLPLPRLDHDDLGEIATVNVRD